MRKLCTLAALLVAGHPAAGCSSDALPTSILVQLRAEPELRAPTSLQLTVFDQQAQVVQRPLVLDGGELLPNDVVLYPPTTEALRLWVQARDQRGLIGEAAAEVTPRAGAQVTVALLVTSGRLPDRDGDGIPDTIDNCPDVRNPNQQPICRPDGGPDGPTDAGIDTGDASPDGPRDQGLDRGDGPHPDLAQDTLPPDTLPPDTLAPDTLAPDTLSPDLPCSCPLGCRPTGGCYEIEPSNGFTANSYTPITLGSVDYVIDTSACTWQPLALTGSKVTKAGETACLFRLRKLELKSGSTISVRGDLPLVLLVRDGVTIPANALIDVGAEGGVPGPGGALGGEGVQGPGIPGAGAGGGQVCVCGAVPSDQDDCGGGGGSFGGAGGAGGPETVYCGGSSSDAGATYGTPTLIPLAGGSGGATGGQRIGDPLTSPGGAGGGALQISCQAEIRVDGAISAGGGGGASGGPMPRVAGAGGGSGGAILLEAASFAGTGVIAANGGGGGGATRHSSGCSATDGEDGKPGQTPAQGGSSCNAAGGDGAAGSFSATAGVAGGANGTGGGGGGGGLGIVRFNWYKHKTAPPLATSGKASTGEVGLL
jgi:hypothetical protein